MLKRIVFIALLALPVAAWALVKPVRVLAPQLAGLTCHGEVCVDDPSRLPEGSSTQRSEEHTSELQSPDHLVCRLLLEKKKNKFKYFIVPQTYPQIRLAHHNNRRVVQSKQHSRDMINSIVTGCSCETKYWFIYIVTRCS